jgi:hypothetical protein
MFRLLSWKEACAPTGERRFITTLAIVDGGAKNIAESSVFPPFMF